MLAEITLIYILLSGLSAFVGATAGVLMWGYIKRRQGQR